MATTFVILVALRDVFFAGTDPAWRNSASGAFARKHSQRTTTGKQQQESGRQRHRGSQRGEGHVERSLPELEATHAGRRNHGEIGARRSEIETVFARSRVTL